MGTNGLMGATVFADRCGVSVQTVANWVKLGKVVPAQQVGGRNYFSEDNYIQVKIEDVRRLTNKSFLGVIVGSDDSVVSGETAKFIEVLRAKLPDAKMVSSLGESILAMENRKGGSFDSVTYTVFKCNVVEAMCRGIRSAVFDVLKEVFVEHKSAVSKFSMDNFLCFIFNDNVDTEFVKSYAQIGVKKTEHTLVGIRNAATARMQDVIRKYGVLDSVIKLGVSYKSIYYDDVEVLLKDDSVKVNIEEPLAKSIYKTEMAKLTKGTANRGYSDICQNGYFSVVEFTGGVFDDNQLFKVLNSLNNREYACVYINSRSDIPAILDRTLMTGASAGKFNLIIGDEE